LFIHSALSYLVAQPSLSSFPVRRPHLAMASLQAVQADQAGLAAGKPLDIQVDTIWQMALASFSANKECIVLPLEYENLLSAATIEELKARLR